MDPITIGGAILICGGTLFLVKRKKKDTTSFKEEAKERSVKRSIERAWEDTRPMESAYSALLPSVDGLDVKEVEDFWCPKYRASLSKDERRVIDALLHNADMTKVEYDEPNYEFSRSGVFRA